MSEQGAPGAGAQARGAEGGARGAGRGGGYNNLVELFERSRREYAARRLFGVKKAGSWEWLTYARVGEMVDDSRAALAKLGVGRGDKVAIVADNRVEWAVACYATYGLGAAFVPMYQAQLAKEWEFILGDCAAKVVIGATPEIHAKLSDMKSRLPALQHVIGFDIPTGDEAWQTLLEIGRRTPVAPASPAPSDVAGLIYTSGTTGMPKGVILSHGNIVSNINAMNGLLPLTDDECSLAFLPWAHSFGQVCELHLLVGMGAAIAINDEIPQLIPNLAEVKPTLLFAVPRIFNRIYDGVNKQIAGRPGLIQSLFHQGIAIAKRREQGESIGLFDQALLWLADTLIFSTVRERFGGRLKYAVSGSAALNRDVADFIDALGITVYEGYGLTETSPITSANYPGNRKLGSVGKPIPGVTVRIDHAITGDPVHGEIIVYGPNVMQGYHNRDDENRAVLLPDGGFRTGDMGMIDDDGFLHITGRIKEQYKLETGKYVVPSPIEEAYKLSPYIVNIFVHGENKPHNVAVIVPDVDALRSWAERSRVALSDVAGDARVRELIRSELDRLSRDLKGYERIEKFLLTNEDFTTENGMLTPSLKLKRRVVLERYRAALEGLY
jgi:long-chain acyl-CoA synthetase